MRLLLAFLLGLSFAAAQSIPANRVTFSGAWTRQVGGYSYEPKETATGLGFSYGYRFHPHIEAEAGLFMALDPTGNICTAYGCVDVRDRFYWIPFGVRFVAPLYLDRIEFSAGGGGLYEKYTMGSASPYGMNYGRDGFGGYFVGSVGVALDRRRRFWLSGTPRWFLANPAYARDRWFQIAGEVSVRF